MALKTSAQVELELRERILRQKLQPGSQLKEEPLADELGAPRNAVRSALLALENRGLVQRIPNKGAIVARVDLDRLLSIYDVFELLEGLTAKLAAKRSKPEDWDQLIALFGPELEQHIAQGEYEEYFSAVEQYRKTVNDLAGNAYVSELLSNIYDQTYTIIRRVLITPGRAQQSMEEHREILAALQRGDSESAERLKLKNMVEGRQALIKYRDFLF